MNKAIPAYEASMIAANLVRIVLEEVVVTFWGTPDRSRLHVLAVISPQGAYLRLA